MLICESKSDLCNFLSCWTCRASEFQVNFFRPIGKTFSPCLLSGIELMPSLHRCLMCHVIKALLEMSLPTRAGFFLSLLLDSWFFFHFFHFQLLFQLLSRDQRLFIHYNNFFFVLSWGKILIIVILKDSLSLIHKLIVLCLWDV